MTVWIVLGSILLLLLLLLCTPVQLRMAASNSDISASISFLGIIKKRLYPLSPRPKSKKRKTKNKAEVKKSSPKPKKDKGPAMQRLRELRSLIAAILIRMPRTFSLRIKRLTLDIATDDPAKTALLYGAVSSTLAFTLEWLDRHLLTIRRIRGGALSVYADFDGEETRLEADLRLYTSLLRLLSLGVKVLLPYFIKHLKKNKKISKQRKELPHVRSEKQAQRAD